MGKTSKPRTFMVDADLFGTEKITKLAKQGHTILALPSGVDFVLAKGARYMTRRMLESNLLDLMLKRARAEE